MSNTPQTPFGEEVASILDARFRRLRRTQNELAALVCPSQSQISKFLLGKVTMTVNELDALCDALGLSIVDVVREASENTDARTPARGYLTGDAPSDRDEDHPGARFVYYDETMQAAVDAARLGGKAELPVATSRPRKRRGQSVTKPN